MRRELNADRRLLLVVPLLLAATILASALAGCRADGAVPNVVINDPPNNSEVTLSEGTRIRSTATDATGVVKIELWVDDVLYTSDLSPVAQGQSPFSVAQNWTPQASGSHKIVVRAYNAAGNMGESAPITLIAVGEPSPTPTATKSVGPPPTVTPTPTQPPPTESPATPPPPTSTPPAPPPTATPHPTSTPVPGVCLPSFVRTIPVEGHPKGVAAYGDRVYVGIHDAPRVVVIDADTNTVSTTLDTHVSGPRYANGVAFHPDVGRIYVANRDAGSVSSISVWDPSDWNVIPTGPLPFGVAATSHYLYVSNFGDGTVGRIEVATDTYLTSIVLPSGYDSEPALLAPLARDVFPLGLDVFVPTNGPGPIYRIRPSGGPIEVGPSEEGYFAAAANSNDRVFVTNRQTGQVARLSARTHSIEAAMSMPHTPYSIAVHPLKNRVYVVAAGANLLYVLDGATLQILGSVSVGPQDATEGGQGIAVLGDIIYVSNYQGSSVTVLDDSACEAGETESLLQQIREAFAEKYGEPIERYDVRITRSTDTHAQGWVDFVGEMSGGWWLGFKEPGGWIIVADGHAMIMCADIEPYDFPIAMVPECWDQVAGEYVVR